MKSLVSIVLILAFSLLLQACKKPICDCFPPLGSELMGKWEWVKTVSPSRTVTPQTEKFSRILQRENDGNRDYIALYQNDSLHLQLTQSRTFYQENKEQFTVLHQYGSQYLKYYLMRGSSSATREMQTSELMDNYTEQADTIRHYYRYIGR